MVVTLKFLHFPDFVIYPKFSTRQSEKNNMFYNEFDQFWQNVPLATMAAISILLIFKNFVNR